MVLGRGNKNSQPAREVRSHELPLPPPPYKENSYAAPVIVAETTKTTRTEVVTTTTQTTTHFFSLPLWRRRPATAPSSVRQSFSGGEEFGLMTNTPTSGAFMIDKALPPTPTVYEERPAEAKEIPQKDLMMNGTADVAAPNIMMSPSKSDGPSRRPRHPPPPKLALAKASLGLGLTNITIPQTSTSFSSPDINTVAFATSAAMEAPQAGVRRVQSSQKLKVTRPSDDHATLLRKSLDFGERRRTRDNSTSGNTIQSADKGKGKGTDPPAQSLSRRPSFWSRKKKEDMSSSSAFPTAPERTARPSLPPLSTTSPFNMGASSSTPPSTSQHHHDSSRSPGLSRSVSERASSRSPTSRWQLDPNISSTSPKRSPRSPGHRPATANSHTHISPRALPSRPSTADAPSRAPPVRFSSVDPSSSRPPMKPSITLPHQDTHLQESSSPTRRRPRSQTNPPLLHRLSVGLFSSGPAPTTKASGVFGPNVFTSSAMPLNDSPRLSISRPSVEVPKPHVDEESPDVYLERLLSVVSKAEVAGVLASSGDPFYANALRLYIGRFSFRDDPLDVALRKLLMEVGLPRETQQIDRVVEAFAAQYVQSNPNLFASEDHPYILAFSLIMLHTDAFNKSNKRKMTKPDYVKNTRLPGVPPEVLDCFFDNIVFAPFIFIEDPLDINGQRGLVPEGISRMSSQSASPASGSTSTLLGKGSKIDPYFLITHNLLDHLRVPVETHVPLESPYSFKGTGDQWNEEDLQRAFARAAVIEVGAVDTCRPSSAFLPVSVGGMPGPIGALGDFFPPTGEIWTLKVAKVSLLDRKDDIVEGGKKATNRKWKTWSVVLTGSQLLFFRDPSWATSLLAQSNSPDGHVIIPQASLFKPDELLSVKDAIAVFDKSYTKYQHTLRFVVPDGRQFLLRASNEKELDDWISHINYASAFKSTGIRMRALGMSDKDMELTGVAAATSHLHDMQYRRLSAQRVHSWDGEAAHDLMDMLSGNNEPFSKKNPVVRRVTMVTGRNDMDLDVPIAPEIEGAHQFKVTFDEVKAELAAGNWSSSGESSETEDKPRARSLDSVAPGKSVPTRSNSLPLPSRSQIIQSKVRDLESRITAAKSSLDADMRFVRNVAILTPFQKATRDRLQAAVQHVSKRIMRMRIDLIKLMCHRDVLAADLAAERRDMHTAKDLAFRAATETLQSRRGTNVPQMTLSFHEDEDDATPQSLHPKTPHRPESSIADSFHSALDFGLDWSVSDGIAASSFFEVSHIFDSPSLSTPITPAGIYPLSESFPFPYSDSNPESGARNLDRTPSSRTAKHAVSTIHEKFYTASNASEEAEECEDWNKTRAAKRVSLVRVPSDIRPSSRFKYSHHANIEEDTNPSDTGS